MEAGEGSGAPAKSAKSTVEVSVKELAVLGKEQKLRTLIYRLRWQG